MKKETLTLADAPTHARAALCCASLLVLFTLTPQRALAGDDSAALGEQLAMENPEGGGSIRAKREPDMTAQSRKADKRNIQARVVSVKKAAFPQVALLIKVTKVAEDGPNKDAVKKDQEIIIVPSYKMAGKTADMADAETQLNAGAFYLTDGDSIVVRLDAPSGKMWKAGYIERR